MSFIGVMGIDLFLWALIFKGSYITYVTNRVNLSSIDWITVLKSEYLIQGKILWLGCLR